MRPIAMTAIATVAGMLPLALAIGAGSQMLQPLAIAVIGGLLSSMVLSLVFTPAINYFLHRGVRVHREQARPGRLETTHWPCPKREPQFPFLDTPSKVNNGD